MSTHNMFSWRNKKNIIIFQLKKNALSEAMNINEVQMHLQYLNVHWTYRLQKHFCHYYPHHLHFLHCCLLYRIAIFDCHNKNFSYNVSSPGTAYILSPMNLTSSVFELAWSSYVC